MENNNTPLWRQLNEKRTQGEWTINHWSHGDMGVRCIKKEDGITYFSGDAVYESQYGIRSKIDPMEYNIQGSFEGAHIAEISDFKSSPDSATESKANAQYTCLAVNNFAKLADALDGVSTLLDFVINATPSGAVRNLLTDANILAKTALKDIS